jgi:hypothetical protein
MCAGKLDEGCVGSDIGPSGSYLRSELTAHGDNRRHRQRGGFPGPDCVASEPPEQGATCAGQSDPPKTGREPKQQSPAAVVLAPGKQQPFQIEAPRVVDRLPQHGKPLFIVVGRRVLRSIGEIRVEDDQKPDREAICKKVGHRRVRNCTAEAEAYDNGESLRLPSGDVPRNPTAGFRQAAEYVTCRVELRRLDSALVYAEDIWDIEPYNRCSEIMDRFGITCCVTESLPNYNSAMAFAHRHPGRVFTAGYGSCGIRC